MNCQSTFLYVGTFDFRSNFGVAKRVGAIALMLKELGYDACFFDISFGNEFKCRPIEGGYCGFRVFEVGCQRIKDTLRSIPEFDEFFNTVKDELLGIVYYHYYSWISRSLSNYSKMHDLLFLHDITEWYYPVLERNMRLPKAIIDYLIRWMDINISMRMLLKRSPSICISKRLAGYYSKKALAVWIPFVSNQPCRNSYAPNDEPVFLSAIASINLNARKERFDWVLRAVYDLMEEGIKFKLIVIGVTKDEACSCFPLIEEKILLCSENVLLFNGKIPNSEVLQQIEFADFCVFAREHNRRTDYGFPTKLSESFSCATPVVTTPTSDISHFVLDGKTGFCAKSSTYEGFCDAFRKAAISTAENRMAMHQNLKRDNPLEYSKWMPQLKEFFDSF